MVTDNDSRYEYDFDNYINYSHKCTLTDFILDLNSGIEPDKRIQEELDYE